MEWPFIDRKEDNHEGAFVFDTIKFDFDSYLKKHNNIHKLIDLTYMVADIGMILNPNFLLNNYSLIVSLLVNFGSTNYIWIFTGWNWLADTTYLIG